MSGSWSNLWQFLLQISHQVANFKKCRSEQMGESPFTHCGIACGPQRSDVKVIIPVHGCVVQGDVDSLHGVEITTKSVWHFLVLLLEKVLSLVLLSIQARPLPQRFAANASYSARLKAALSHRNHNFPLGLFTESKQLYCAFLPREYLQRSLGEMKLKSGTMFLLKKHFYNKKSFKGFSKNWVADSCISRFSSFPLLRDFEVGFSAHAHTCVCVLVSTVSLDAFCLRSKGVG